MPVTAIKENVVLVLSGGETKPEATSNIKIVYIAKIYNVDFPHLYMVSHRDQMYQRDAPPPFHYVSVVGTIFTLLFI